MSAEVKVVFIALPIEFDGSQASSTETSGSIKLKFTSMQRRGNPRCDKRDAALRWLQRWTCCGVG
jgi:hypothetical protein